jgi:RAD51-like protein 1
MVLMQTTRNDSCSSIHDNNKNKMDYFPTGLGLLDQYLRGGCRIGSLTEVVGCAGIGKSQLAMQMALLAVTMKRAGTILIDTESKISISRLQEMDVARNQTQSYNALSHIAIHTPDSLDALRAVLNTLEDEILDSLNGPFSVRLLIVDSIAAPIRRSEMAYSAAQQASVALGIAQTLKRLADQFRLVVLIINQVGGVCWVQQQQQQNNTTTHIHPHATIGSEPNEFNKNHQQQHIPNFNATAVTTTKAALGTAWHHCVSTRIRLDQPSQSPQSSHLENHHHHHHHRYATVVKSNVVAPSPPLAYRITNEGLVDEIGKEKHKVMDTRRQTFLGPIE